MSLPLHEFNPRPMLVTKTSLTARPRFPVIDAHNHLAEPFGGGWDKRSLAELIDLLDEADVRVYVDLDGGWGEPILEAHLDYFKAPAPERFRIFGGVDWSSWEKYGDQFGEQAARSLRHQAKRGAEGLKIWKPFGLHVRDQRGSRVPVDDERLVPLWETAAELRLPVMIHVADPVAFFEPLDNTNERWEELHAHPDWHFPAPPFPPFLQIMREFANLVARHPNTTFIGAHVGCYAENLAWVSHLLDRCPNFYIDPSARLGELGRQPYSARKFFINYADRICFGTDAGPDLEAYRLCYRFFETDDECFNYSPDSIPPQGRWHICGLYLPEDVLEKLYFLNAQRVILGAT
jgi:predicted TIM-barrel fold metal-dependent hydrolase